MERDLVKGFNLFLLLDVLCPDGTKLNISDFSTGLADIRIIDKILKEEKLQRIFDKILGNELIARVLTSHSSMLCFEEFGNEALLFDSTMGIKEKTDKILSIIAEEEQYEGFGESSLQHILSLPNQIYEETGSKELTSLLESQRDILGIEDISSIFQAMKASVRSDFNRVGRLMRKQQKPILESGLKKREKLLTSASIKEKDYHDTIENLSTVGAISPAIGIFWCRKHPRRPFSALVFSYPVQAQVLCPDCEKKEYMESAMLFSFDPLLRTCIQQKDGLIFYLILWQLEKNRIKWMPRISKERNDECDIVCEAIDRRGYFLIECTMRKRKDDKDPLSHNIRTKVQQLIKNMKIWKEMGIPLLGGILVMNYLDGKEFKSACEEVRNEFETKMKSLNIKILPQNKMPENLLFLLGKKKETGY